MKLVPFTAALALAAAFTTGCDREPTSRTAYINSGASAQGTAPDAIAAPPAPNIKPPSADLAIPSTVPSQPAEAAQPATPAVPAPTVTATTPDTASPAAPAAVPPASAPAPR
jgi:hypothetical protein